MQREERKLLSSGGGFLIPLGSRVGAVGVEEVGEKQLAGQLSFWRGNLSLARIDLLVTWMCLWETRGRGQERRGR